jgi:hypothetical protein
MAPISYILYPISYILYPISIAIRAPNGERWSGKLSPFSFAPLRLRVFALDFSLPRYGIVLKSVEEGTRQRRPAPRPTLAGPLLPQAKFSILLT